MGVATEKYIRKPLYVDAVRVDQQNFEEIAAWCQGEILVEDSTGRQYVKVRVHQPKNIRQTRAFVGDWILYTERGYKVYTNKAFRGAFDRVADVEPKAETETPTRLGPDTATPHEKDQRAVQELDAPLSEEEEAAEGEVAEEPVLEELPSHTPQGEEIEYVEATPEAIADAVREEQPEEVAVRVEESPTAPPEPIQPPEVAPQPEPVSEQPPEDAAAGKRVLSLEEQQQLGPDAVRELVSAGDTILAQDLAEAR